MVKDPKKVKAGKKAKTKGANFERTLVKNFQDWWCKTYPDAQFARTPRSGGSELADGWSLAGDIACNDPKFPFHIEAKNQEAWDLEQVVQQKGIVLDQWWKQCTKESKKSYIPLLVFTRNYKPTFFMTLNTSTLESIFTSLEKSPISMIILTAQKKRPCLVIGLLDDLFNTAPEQWIISSSDN